jgi:hypothetical protein
LLPLAKTSTIASMRLVEGFYEYDVDFDFEISVLDPSDTA